MKKDIERDTDPPTIDEMRRVAHYMADILNLHSAAGKLLARAQYLEQVLNKIGQACTKI